MQVARIQITYDSKEGGVGELLPIDIALCGQLLDIFYLTCLIRQEIRPDEYQIRIDRVSYSNPFDILAFLKNVSKETAKFVLDRTIFYKQERERLELSNELLREDVIAKRIDNMSKINQLRKDLQQENVPVEQSAEQMARILADQRATLQIPPPSSFFDLLRR